MKKRAKKPVVAWIVSADDVDGFGVYGARTEAGALGFARRAWREAFGEREPGEFDMKVERCGAMDDWIADKEVGTGWDLPIALYQLVDAVRDERCVTVGEVAQHRKDCAHFGDVSEKLDAVLATMRKDGQGVTSDQRLTIRRGLGLP